MFRFGDHGAWVLHEPESSVGFVSGIGGCVEAVRFGRDHGINPNLKLGGTMV